MRGLRAVQGLEDSGDLQHDRARLWVVHPLGAVQRVLEHVFKRCGETQSCWGTAPHTPNTRWWELSSQQLPGERGPGTPQTPAPRISSADTEGGVVTVGGGRGDTPTFPGAGTLESIVATATRNLKTVTARDSVTPLPGPP